MKICSILLGFEKNASGRPLLVRNMNVSVSRIVLDRTYHMLQKGSNVIPNSQPATLRTRHELQ
jgi:hypothetical protein